MLMSINNDKIVVIHAVVLPIYALIFTSNCRPGSEHAISSNDSCETLASTRTSSRAGSTARGGARCLHGLPNFGKGIAGSATGNKSDALRPTMK